MKPAKWRDKKKNKQSLRLTIGSRLMRSWHTTSGQFLQACIADIKTLAFAMNGDLAGKKMWPPMVQTAWPTKGRDRCYEHGRIVFQTKIESLLSVMVTNTSRRRPATIDIFRRPNFFEMFCKGTKTFLFWKNFYVLQFRFFLSFCKKNAQFWWKRYFWGTMISIDTHSRAKLPL